MVSLSVTSARAQFSDLIDKVAFKGERIILRRNGKTVGALVSADDARLLEALGDRIDIQEAQRRLRDGNAAIPYEQVRAELGLD